VTCNSRFMRLLAAAILAVPLPLVVYADEHGSGPAVSGFNTKFSAEGGILEDQGGGLVQGSLTTPLGHAFGFQLDGALGTIDGDTMGGAGMHLFTRDPSSYLFGVYGSYHTWDSIDVSRIAAEAELYRGRITLSGVAGWESIDVPGTKGGLAVVNKDDDHVFTELDLSFYPKDNMRLTAGYHYENEKSLGVAEFEYLPQWKGMPMSIFATGNFGDNDHTRVTGGIRFYFGADRNKSLIRRHREDDPGSYTPVFPDLKTETETETETAAATTNFCPIGVTQPAGTNCTCPQDTERVFNKGGGFECQFPAS